jgi:ppGpp synthetase/RelA/SpoT-type nucleotidyltranferase
MQDIAGCRVVVPNIQVQDQVVERLKSALPKADVIDRRKQPSFGYRAVHVVATARNKLVEIQVRTEMQHVWAQMSEQLSDLAGPALKYGGGDSEAQQILARISRATALFEEKGPPASAADLVGGISQFLKYAIEKLIASAKPDGGG